MNSNLSAVLSMIGALAVISTAAPAGAAILSPRAGASVSISNDHRPALQSVCNYTFTYLQRMTISGGPSGFVPTEFIYHPGNYKLRLIGNCNGGFLYGVGDCACLQEPGADPSPEPPPADRASPRPTPLREMKPER
jgi:hypothetical protein